MAKVQIRNMVTYLRSLAKYQYTFESDMNVVYSPLLTSIPLGGIAFAMQAIQNMQ